MTKNHGKRGRKGGRGFSPLLEDRFRIVKSEVKRRSREEGIRERAEVLRVEEWKKYIEKYNPPLLMEALDKIEEKRRLKSAGVVVPETYLVLSDPAEVERAEGWRHLLPKRGFVVKPSRGHAGSGVLLVRRIVGRRFIGEAGDYLDIEDIKNYAKEIISGKYSRGRPDQAIFEELLRLSAELRELATIGLPDIRVISFWGFPVMAMIRLPTALSRGRANVHKGAIAAGISISRGLIVGAVLKRERIERHPDTGVTLVGRRIPHWKGILQMAVRAQEASGLGYAGVDVTLSRQKGVVVIEVNRRPGLEIQNANFAGLKRRLKVVESWYEEGGGELTPEERVNMAREWDKERWRLTK